jgi:hypothetical protein
MTSDAGYGQRHAHKTGEALGEPWYSSAPHERSLPSLCPQQSVAPRESRTHIFSKSRVLQWPWRYSCGIASHNRWHVFLLRFPIAYATT